MRRYTLTEKLLIITGALLLLSLPLGSTLMLTLSLTLFIIMVVINMKQIFGKNMISNIESGANLIIKDSINNKKYVKAGITYLALPMVAVGVILVLTQLVIMWTMVF